MSVLSAADIARRRTEAGLLWNASATIQRSTKTRTGGGGFTELYATIATAPCRVARFTRFRGELVTADRRINESFWVIRLPWDTDIKSGDHVIIGAITYVVDDPQPLETDAATRTVLAKAL